uniref:AB hydrolase-1 domain-containing protein n=1 Tax=Rhizophora mucronata TaxID=61149 RepID=A0A2P2IPQ3_RHIMU
MEEVGRTNTWRDEPASLVDARLLCADETIGISAPMFDVKKLEFVDDGGGGEETESLKEQVTGFLKSWGEMLLDLGKGCKDIVQQSLVTEDSFIVQKLGKPMAKVSARLKFLNEFLPEDRDPVFAWPVILFVFLLALAALNVNTTYDSSVPAVKRVRVHSPTASRILLPDGRQIAYRQQGVSADRARYSMISPHSFLSSRLAGIPGIKTSLLEEFGVRFITYDLPGFGESDPHPSRDLNTSALDILHLANAVGVNNKFWLLGYSSGSMHSWAVLKHTPERIAGAAFFAPMINPYEPGMTKDEVQRTWNQWLPRRKFMYFLAQKFPKFLSSFYRNSFLSGSHSRIDKWLSLSLGRKDELLVNEPIFEEFWHRDVEESVRQGSAKPFIEEAVLQVSNWGFTLADLHVQTKCQGSGILQWFRSMYSQAECEVTGFLGPIHIWQGMDDLVVPSSMTDYISRVLPRSILHKLPDQGHFSFFFFCDECHRQILFTLFGDALGPLDKTAQVDYTPSEGDMEVAPKLNGA